MHVADALLGMLAPLGIAVPPGAGRAELPYLQEPLPIPPFPSGTVPIAVAPATNMPCKCWPLERFAEVLRGLAEVAPIHPVLFGGAGDRELCAGLLRDTGLSGTLVVGETIAQAASTMRACSMYLGNDTGVMHLAAATGRPCVAVFSARDLPGAWYPYGEGHRVFRTPLPCDACFGHTCPLGTNECILRISASEVLAACTNVLGERGGTR
jgi:ADP-heptose:LPS heptosyltransferase